MLYLGTAKVNITPRFPVPLAGFSSRQEMGGFEGISHPLYARILCLQHREADGKATSAVLISADLLWWGSELISQLKQRIRERWPADEIIFHATHTHSGPQTADNFSSLLGALDPDYLVELVSGLMEGIDAAARRMEPVTVEQGRGECAIAVNRRCRADNEIHISPNPKGPVDQELTVIRYRVSTGRVKAVLVHYACHPVVTSDNLISSEFTGVAMDELEQSIGEDVVCAYLQGTCGDINPVELDGGSDEQVVELGLRLAADIRKVLNAPMQAIPSVSLRSEELRIELPLQALPEREYLESMQMEPAVMGEWSRNLLQSLDKMKHSLPFEVTGLTLAEGITLFAMNAEVVVAYGLYLKSISGNRILPLGYSNGMIGYIPTADQLAEGGYEPIDSTFYFSMPAPFDPSIEQILREALQQFHAAFHNDMQERREKAK